MISIIIVNYNLSREIIACIDSLHLHLTNRDYEVIVVDNASSDQALSELIQTIEERKNVHFMPLDENIGFGSACNRGATSARGTQLCFLNPDTSINHDFLADLELAQSTTNAAIVGPGYNQRSLIEFSAGLFPCIWLEFLAVFFVGRHIEALVIGLRAKWAGSKGLPVDWVLGACMLMPKNIFDRIGGFDEDYFLYFEEMDLCKRVSDSGGRRIFVPDCIINHIGSVSGKKDYVLFTSRFYAGKIRYLYKQTYGWNRRVLLKLVWLQLHTQKVLWKVLSRVNPDKSRQKLQGFDLALVFFNDCLKNGYR